MRASRTACRDLSELFYELRPLPHAEAGYGYPDSGQTVINVTNGKLIRLLVDDEPFDVRYGELQRHERVLSLRDGHLRRSVEWTSPAGKTVSVVSTRLVSMTHRAIAAICYEVSAGRPAGPGRGAVRTGRQRAAARAERRPAGRRGPHLALGRGGARAARDPGDAGAHHPPQRAAASARPWTTSSPRPVRCGPA